MEVVRSFIAIELPEEVKQELTQLEAQLKTGRQSSVKWVDPYGIHLTLKFLGDVALDSINALIKAIAEAAQGIPPFHLEIRDLGVFPSLTRVQIVWVGISGELDRLSQLQQRIESNFAQLGFAPESRPFVPHLTLARVREQVLPNERQRLGQLIASTKFEAAHGFKVDSISLMKSQLTREGAIYSRISSIELPNPPLPTAPA